MRMPPMRPPRICPTRPRIPPMRPPRSLPLPLPVVMSRSFSGADSVPVAPARDLSHAPSGVATTTLHRLPRMAATRSLLALLWLKRKAPVLSVVVLPTTLLPHTSCTRASGTTRDDRGKHI